MRDGEGFGLDHPKPVQGEFGERISVWSCTGAELRCFDIASLWCSHYGYACLLCLGRPGVLG